jgi:hypothetical protein
MLKILILSANPVDVRYLSVDQEYHRIDEALKIRSGEIDIKYWPATSPRDFPRKINQHTPDILHFSGHASSVGNLVFQRDNDTPEEVAKDPITTVLEILGDSLKCIILNACYSQAQAREIVQKINCVVIGMPEKVMDDSAVKFSESFYDWIGLGKSIADAIRLSEYDMGNMNKIEVEKRPTVDLNKIYLLKDRKSSVGDTVSNVDLALLLKKVPRKISCREFWEENDKGNLGETLQDLLDKGGLGDNEKETIGTMLARVPVRLDRLEELNRFYSKKNSEEIVELQEELISIYRRAIELIRGIKDE